MAFFAVATTAAAIFFISNGSDSVDDPFDAESANNEEEEESQTERGANQASTAVPVAPNSGTLRIGGLLPETGNLEFLGPPSVAAVEVAVQDINAAGGVLSTDVEWLPGDSGDDGEVAKQTVDRLLTEDVSAFVGAISSGVTLTVIDKITQAGKILLSPSNSLNRLTEYNDDGLYFRTSATDVSQGAALVDTMIADGAQTAALLALNDPYGTELLENIRGPYEARGGAVVFDSIYEYDADSFDSQVAGAVDANADAIVIIGFDETSRILTGLLELGVDPSTRLVYGTDGNTNAALARSFDDPSVVAGMKGTLPGVDVVGEYPLFRDALDAVDPGLVDCSYSAESYDALIIIALAALVADSTDGVAIGAEINDVTRDGEVCFSFQACSVLIGNGINISYGGTSDPLEFTDAGEPSLASVIILGFDAAGDLQVSGSVIASS